MKTEYYQEQLKSTFRTIGDLKLNIERLKEEFAKECNPFKMGAKYKITHPTGQVDYGIAIDVEVESDWNGEFHIVPVMATIKKDGTAHPRNRVYIGYFRFNDYKFEEV